MKKERRFYTGREEKKSPQHLLDLGDGRGEVPVTMLGEAVYEGNNGIETFYKGNDGKLYSFVEDPYGLKRIIRNIPGAKIDFARAYTAEPGEVVMINGHRLQITDKDRFRVAKCEGDVPFSQGIEVTEIIGVYPDVRNGGDYSIRLLYPGTGRNQYQLAITAQT